MKLILIVTARKIVAFGAQKTRTHTLKSRRFQNVWCGFCSRGITGLFFFENEQREAVTVSGDRYRSMLNEFLFTKIEEKDIGKHLVSTERMLFAHLAAAI